MVLRGICGLFVKRKDTAPPFYTTLLGSVAGYLYHVMLTCGIPMTHNDNAGQPECKFFEFSSRHCRLKSSDSGMMVWKFNLC